MSTLSAGTKQRIDADGFAVIAGVLGYREMDTLKGDMDKTPLHRSRAGARHMLGNASVAALASDPRLLEIARQVLGAEERRFEQLFSINLQLPTGLLSGIKTLRCHCWNVMSCSVGDRGLLRRALSTPTPQRQLWNKSSRCAFTLMNQVIEMAHYACFLERTQWASSPMMRSSD